MRLAGFSGCLRNAVLVCMTTVCGALPSPAAIDKAPVSLGVSQALAVERATRVTDVHYDLALTLRPHTDSMPGHVSLRFTLRNGGGDGDLALDYRDGTLTSLSVNGSPASPVLVDGHIILPASLLRAGENKVDAVFASRIAGAGAAITRYEDKDDGSEYLYSLFVPMDASMAFPCFDQPDLKAVFTLSVDAPSAWTVIGNNASGEKTQGTEGLSITRFPETRPISTYLFAFAAGTWANVHPAPGQPAVWVRRSQVKRAEPEVPQLQAMTADGMKWLTEYFQQPFPFPKYDLVLIPGFPFGGMEHAGATFLREDAVLFRSAPTESDRFGRNILTLHELTHQWFGDLVTMRWFDDLWLKEGFAQYMAYRCLDSMQPKAGAWKHFYEDIKPSAYGIDETEGTTPIFQNIPNLKDAKSAYGAIVYQKAPSILKQLEFRLGADGFRDGLRLYLKQHAYANARWGDLIDAFHTSTGQDVRTWADAWVLRRGMPEVTVSFKCSAGKLSKLTLSQKDVLPDGFVWPIANEVLLSYPSSRKASLFTRMDWKTSEAEVKGAIGKPCPDYVFANSGDQAYGRFLLDDTSEQAVHRNLVSGFQTDSTDPLLRSMVWGALWDNVHVAKSAPRGYVELVLANLPSEADETMARIQGSHAITALHSYMTPQGRSSFVPKLEEIATIRMTRSPAAGLRIVSFRTLTGAAETPSGLTTLKAMLAGKMSVPGVELRPLDRWNLVAKLIAMRDPDAPAVYAAELKRDLTGDAEKFAFAAVAGTPDDQIKKQYFREYSLPPKDAKPEDWLTQSLRPFNSWNQSQLTAPYLRLALEQLPEIKRDRRIFYLGAWLGAFLGGQVSAESQAVVEAWLAQPGIDPDLRLKVLESVDELRRTVSIRKRYPD